MDGGSLKNLFYLNFANQTFERNRKVACEAARRIGIENILSLDEETFTTSYQYFINKHSEIFSQKRGFGYWLWKPFLIVETLKVIPKGSVLMYADTGVFFEQSVEALVELAREHQQVFFNMPNHPNKDWTKRDVFIALDADLTECWEKPQVKAQWHLWKAGDDSIQKATEWLRFCTDPQLLTDSPSRAENFPSFREHRHDQSILSVLVWKWKNLIFRDPTQEGLDFVDRFPNSPYPQLALARGLLSSP